MHPSRRLWLLQLARLARPVGLGLAAWPLALRADPREAAGVTARAAEKQLSTGTGASTGASTDSTVQPGRTLSFPADHGAHLAARTEWWYATGWLGSEAAPTHGFQITFFRSRTGLAADNRSRFAARHLLFAHAAVTALAAPGAKPGHAHDQRMQRWSGAPDAATGHAALGRGAVQLDGWQLHDDGSAWRTQAKGEGLALDLTLTRTQPLLLQGQAGFSRKGPELRHASHYYSEPQLAASGRLRVAGRETAGQGRAWMDHEWSDEILAEGAVGWDWIGINLFDGSALTAFVLRRADGSTLWAGGSHRRPGAAARIFAAEEVRFTAGRRWRSPSTAASYPVEWQVQSPAGALRLRALADAQELDGRTSTGTVYWEGLSELLDTQGRRIGLGYLEMTGYAAALKL